MFRFQYASRSSSVSTWFDRSRVPKPPPPLETADVPGRLCWGQVGSLPSGEEVDTVQDFNVQKDEEHTEISRKSEDVRITNPDDDRDYVLVERGQNLIFVRVQKGKPLPNNAYNPTATDFGDFSPTPIELTSFKPLGTGDKSSKYRMNLKNTPRSA